MNKNNRKSVIIGAVILVLLLAAFALVYTLNRPTGAGGEKSITIEVTGVDGITKSYALQTNAVFLKEAMDELSLKDVGFSYSGAVSDFGLMVESVNGERALFEKDGAYWALYINGEYGQFGADSQPVTDGDVYLWKYERSN